MVLLCVNDEIEIVQGPSRVMSRRGPAGQEGVIYKLMARVGVGGDRNVTGRVEPTGPDRTQPDPTRPDPT